MSSSAQSSAQFSRTSGAYSYHTISQSDVIRGWILNSFRKANPQQLKDRRTLDVLEDFLFQYPIPSESSLRWGEDRDATLVRLLSDIAFRKQYVDEFVQRAQVRRVPVDKASAEDARVHPNPSKDRRDFTQIRHTRAGSRPSTTTESIERSDLVNPLPGASLPPGHWPDNSFVQEEMADSNNHNELNPATGFSARQTEALKALIIEGCRNAFEARDEAREFQNQNNPNLNGQNQNPNGPVPGAAAGGVGGNQPPPGGGFNLPGFASPFDNWAYAANDKTYFRASEIGYFYPDLPADQGLGNIVNIGSDTFIRDVHVFIERAKDNAGIRGEKVVKANLSLCFRGGAATWYSAALTDVTKSGLRAPETPLSTFTDLLTKQFAKPASKAMRELQQVAYTL